MQYCSLANHHVNLVYSLCNPIGSLKVTDCMQSGKHVMYLQDCGYLLGGNRKVTLAIHLRTAGSSQHRIRPEPEVQVGLWLWVELMEGSLGGWREEGHQPELEEQDLY